MNSSWFNLPFKPSSDWLSASQTRNFADFLLFISLSNKLKNHSTVTHNKV